MAKKNKSNNKRINFLNLIKLLPNTLTFVRLFICFLIIIFGWYAVVHPKQSQIGQNMLNSLHAFPSWTFIAILILFLIAMLTDWLDGLVARSFKVQSPIGAIFDPITDKILVYSTLTLLVIQNYVFFLFLILFILRDLMCDGLRIFSAFSKKKVISANVWGKWKTIVLYLTIIISYAIILGTKSILHANQFIPNKHTMIFMKDVLFLPALILAYISCWNYFYSNLMSLHSKEKINNIKLFDSLSKKMGNIKMSLESTRNSLIHQQANDNPIHALQSNKNDFDDYINKEDYDSFVTETNLKNNLHKNRKNNLNDNINANIIDVDKDFEKDALIDENTDSTKNFDKYDDNLIDFEKDNEINLNNNDNNDDSLSHSDVDTIFNEESDYLDEVEFDNNESNKNNFDASK